LALFSNRHNFPRQFISLRTGIVSLEGYSF
jgi:hypothetical protein